MCAAIWQALRASPKQARPVACRFVAGRRLTSPSRHLHTSTLQRAENDPRNPNESSWKNIFFPAGGANEQTAEQYGNGGPPDEGPEKSRPVDLSHYGSAFRRQGRNKRAKEMPQVALPEWLLDRNVWLTGETPIASALSPESEHSPQKEQTERSAQPATLPSSDQPSKLPPLTKEVYKEWPDLYISDQLRIPIRTRAEIRSLMQAGLRVTEGDRAASRASIKPHLVLSSPKKGASAFLSQYVRLRAQDNNADFLRLSAQDIAQVGGDYMDDPAEFLPNTLSSLSYDVANAASSQGNTTPDDLMESEDAEANEDDDGPENARLGPKVITKTMAMPISVGIMPSMGMMPNMNLSDVLKQISRGAGGQIDPNHFDKSFNGPQQIRIKDDMADMKMTLLVETLLNVPELKRARNAGQTVLMQNQDRNNNGNAQESVSFDVQRGSNNLVILIEDYPLINSVPHGAKFLEKLHEIVDSRRREGQAVLITGTSSSEKLLPPGDAKSAIDDAQAAPWDRWTRTVVVPIKTTTDDGLLWLEHRRKIRETNLRNLRDMLRRTAPNQEQVQAVLEDWNLNIDSKYTFVAAMDRSVWPMHKINRVATVALGQLGQNEVMTAQIIGEALGLIDASDSSKYRWQNREKNKPKQKMDEARPTDGNQQRETAEDSKMRKLRKQCNHHERKLLNGVIDPKNIRTTFADVRAPPETIDALKTLTSLSLLRPDAFTYGVLATDRISGILLYGPPGTGKTLLAKAVAKESGATVLEVSGSDVYDMYVGEGEKNIRAVFSLAKKLSPCVVFIDEADAILGSRTSGPSRSSHRELINQFLREWDGMTETSAFIMVATNRPYDLDEASLRRVPRRLLIDLPTEQDREAILRIHLKGELLDQSVDIKTLASQTPYYSGSDLKNLCVAAALACVKEEYEVAVAHNDQIKNSNGRDDNEGNSNDTARSSTTDTITTGDAITPSTATTSDATDKSSPKPELDTEPPQQPEQQQRQTPPPQQEEYSYPSQRTLHVRHFNKATEEISASISEDMGSLSAIRKFDEKYGDRRGRRKKLGGYGFKTAGKGEAERLGSDAARVRNQT